MNTRRLAGVLCGLVFLPLVGGVSVRAQTDDLVDAVTLKDEQAYSVRGEALEPLNDVLKFPGEVEVNTNGTFTVADGKERKLKEGQVLRRDGWLQNRDGSIEPVMDHVTQTAGQLLVVRDGQATPLTEMMAFPTGLRISPDGWCDYPNGSRARLADGQLFRLNGSPIVGKDTATLKGGHVVVQKDAKLIRLVANQIMGMNDGTKVRGDGFIVQPDGTVIPMREGETLFIEGRATRR